jgi:hypothetical protein
LFGNDVPEEDLRKRQLLFSNISPGRPSVNHSAIQI